MPRQSLNLKVSSTVSPKLVSRIYRPSDSLYLFFVLVFSTDIQSHNFSSCTSISLPLVLSPLFLYFPTSLAVLFVSLLHNKVTHLPRRCIYISQFITLALYQNRFQTMPGSSSSFSSGSTKNASVSAWQERLMGKKEAKKKRNKMCQKNWVLLASFFVKKKRGGFLSFETIARQRHAMPCDQRSNSLSLEACRECNIDPPDFQVVSDQRGLCRSPMLAAFVVPISKLFPQLTRVTVCLPFCTGGRTAWSSRVSVYGYVFSARYWYDGKNVNNAKEDAAEMALAWLTRGSDTSSPPTTRSGW